jgi:MFS-type transporter involved in bile tolerance (Atg22 family)
MRKAWELPLGNALMSSNTAAFRWLPKYQLSSNIASRNDHTSWTRPWLELLGILKDYKRLPESFKYLLAWFIMSDAFSTITSTAVLFAKTTLGMSATSLVFIGVL